MARCGRVLRHVGRYGLPFTCTGRGLEPVLALCHGYVDAASGSHRHEVQLHLAAYKGNYTTLHIAGGETGRTSSLFSTLYIVEDAPVLYIELLHMYKSCSIGAKRHFYIE